MMMPTPFVPLALLRGQAARLGALALLVVLALAALTFSYAPARAAAPEVIRTITNTAKIQWRGAIGAVEKISNQVDIQVENPPEPMPINFTFDSATGEIVDGVRVTLIDANTGEMAEVTGRDGVSWHPASLVSGESSADASGFRYEMIPGQFLFPSVKPGSYRLKVEPPAPYLAPSVATQTDLKRYLRPDRNPYVIVDGSYGGSINVERSSPLVFDIPLDQPSSPVVLDKIASQVSAEAGDAILYTVSITNPSSIPTLGMIHVTDRFPDGMRLNRDSVELDGARVEALVAPDGRSMSIEVGSIAPGGAALLSYVLEVLPDAPAGDALNLASATDARGNDSNIARALVRINRTDLGQQMTIVGRVIDADCSVDPRTAPGIPFVRVMLEDGSYAITDEDGRYHFEGLKPALHVVQIDEATLPGDRIPDECARNTRAAGNPTSRFVEGQSGMLYRVDFRARAGTNERAAIAASQPDRPPVAEASYAAGERDWLVGQAPGVEWLFPEADHNPRAPAVRVAIKHLPGQTIRLSADGRPVDAITYEGMRTDEAGLVAVSHWRGVNIDKDGSTRLVAEVVGSDGQVQRLERTVHFTTTPAHVDMLRERSVLVADGVTRPVIAVRVTDRNGRPMHQGSAGDFDLPEPYRPAMEVDAEQARQLAGLERARPVWRIEGDDGVAYIELEPTTASGTVSLRFNFRDGRSAREQRVETWLEPGNRPWTIVGLASGTVAFDRLSGQMKKPDGTEEDLVVDGRIALFAKGRVKGKWLMTLAYDSDKDVDQARFGGTIDPRAYYTVYADRSERRYEASSIKKFYLRLERPQFYALFGDYVTNIDEPALARYVRAFNGVKAEYQGEQLAGTAFAANAPTRFARDDIQGNGTSGPYALSSRLLLANSERVTIEVRDRQRSNLVVDSKILTRYVDYEIDYDLGTIRFKEPILSRSSMLDPQFIVVEYEVDGIARNTKNAGARGRWRSGDEKFQLAGTVIHDEDERAKTNLLGFDARFRPSANTEVRAEVAMTDSRPTQATDAPAGTASAWQVEVEHRTASIDILAYAREQDAGFGVGQLRAGEGGTRKIGADASVAIASNINFAASVWSENYLGTDNSRLAGRALVEYLHDDFRARAGLIFADDQFGDGRELSSRILQLGAAKSFMGDRLELDGQTEFALGGKNENADFAARHRIAARFAVTRSVDLVGAYELANGEKIDARTARIGFDLKPWAGARISAAANQQDIDEYGPRSFASYGLAQSVRLSEKLSLDFSLDGNKTLSGIDPADVLNTEFPVAAGGYVGGRSVTEDFTAVTAGATYRTIDWTLTGRAEYRAGDQGDRYGLTIGALRQIGEGRAVGGALNHFVATGLGGVKTGTSSAQLSWAHRPQEKRLSFLDKLELREDRVTGAILGERGPIGLPLLVNGDARSRRIINSLTVNYLPGEEDDGEWLDRSEISVFWGTRYVSDQFGDRDIAGWSNLVGADVRYDISDRFDIGPSASLRHSLGARTLAYSLGASVGVSPIRDAWLSLGYNFRGFTDRDFEEARYTRKGLYLTTRFKFDSATFESLGLARR